ncbi:hypothetical protein TSACC_23320 [Terrimicrobium sacchariphilum]|uniref:Uncharacterized protein n=1 Tax=Terrimicrobium sacchariphilum TaxID=690879 RepID=A0A146GEH4_TERSA|nr:hypothetical protein [Terrimicrobium sacchariphilum]GAT34886.1 hypothetical protein TSACC_23320 [Terrimicrobium sacchariphilum]
MRSSLALLLCLSLTACPAKKAGDAATPSPAPEPSATPAQSPVSTPAPVAVIKDPELKSDATEFIGAWSTIDEQGQLFDLLIFPDGQVVTTWTKGKHGARGELGFWRLENNRILIFLEDGWTDSLEKTAEGIVHHGYPPGSSLDKPPATTEPAQKLSADIAGTVGVWRLNKEPDGDYQYLAIQSNGRAFSSVNGGTEGTWKQKGKTIECTWPDGWTDILEATPEGFQKRSFIGANQDPPADVSPAARIGEKPFAIEP